MGIASLHPSYELTTFEREPAHKQVIGPYLFGRRSETI
jgi:hypothetical protein